MTGDADRSLVYLFHIPKTAGTSVNALLREVFGGLHLNRSGLWSDFVTGACWLTDETRCVTGHFGGYLPFCVDRQVRMFTVLRDPVARALSHINHVQRKESHPRHERMKGPSRATGERWAAEEQRYAAERAALWLLLLVPAPACAESIEAATAPEARAAEMQLSRASWNGPCVWERLNTHYKIRR